MPTRLPLLVKGLVSGVLSVMAPAWVTLMAPPLPTVPQIASSSLLSQKMPLVLPAERAVMPFTVPWLALLAIAIVLLALVAIAIAPPSPPLPGERLLFSGSQPTPPWLVARMALPIGVQGVTVTLTPLGMETFATLKSMVGL